MRNALRWTGVLLASLAPLLACGTASPNRLWSASIRPASGAPVYVPNDWPHGAKSALDAQGNLVVVGNVSDGSAPCMLTAKLSSADGSALWSDESCGSEAEGLALDAAGNVYVGATLSGFASVDGISVTPPGLRVLKLSPSGAQLWDHRLDVPGSALRAIAAGRNGDVYVAAEVDTFRVDGQDVMVLRLDADTGAVRWQKRFDSPSHDNDYVGAIGVSPLGTIAVLSSAQSHASSSYGWNLWMLAAADGAAQWERDVDYVGDDIANVLAFEPNGDVVVAGAGKATSGHAVLTLHRFAPDGRQKLGFGVPGFTTGGVAQTMAIDPSGDMIVTGDGFRTSRLYGIDGGDVWSSAYSSEGAGRSIALDNFGGAWVAGVAGSPATPDESFMQVVKFDTANGQELWADRLPATANAPNAGFGMNVSGGAAYAVGVVDHALFAVKYSISDRTDLPSPSHYHIEVDSARQWTVFPGDSISTPLAGRVWDSNGQPVTNYTITVTIDGCGTIGGQASLIVLTDASGSFVTPPFQATGNDMRTCAIVAQGGASDIALVTVALVGFQQILLVPVSGQEIRVDLVPGSNDFRYQIRATSNGTPIAGLPIGWSVSGLDVATAILGGGDTKTDANGYASVNVSPNFASGTYVLSGAVPAANIAASAIVDQRVMGDSTVAFVGATGPASIGVVSPPPGCTIENVRWFDPRAITGRTIVPIPRNLEFMDGGIQMKVVGCTSSVALRVQMPGPIPAGTKMWYFADRPSARGPTWYAAPTTISGNTATFTFVEAGAGDDSDQPDGAINFQLGGLAKPTSYQDMWWGGLAQNGWGISMVQHDDTLFSVVFAYDANGQPTWYVMSDGEWNALRTSVSGSLYSPRGAPYYAYDPRQFVVGPPVGQATFTPSDAANGSFQYTVNGKSGNPAVTRDPFGPASSLPVPAVADMWWGGLAQNGWGIAVLQQYANLFCVWYTYDDNGLPTWFVMPAGAWTAADTYEGRLYRTAGSPWAGAVYDPALFQSEDVGAYRLRFSGDSATFDYSIGERSGTLSLTRAPF